MISVLTVNYRSGDELAGLLTSLREHPGNDAIEVIVCNNSPDETLTLSECANVEVKIIEADNPGFGAGINLAFQQARGDTIFIANPDVRVQPDTIDRAADHLARDAFIGIVLPKIRYPDGELQPSVRRFYTMPVVLYARSPFRGIRRTPGFFREYLYEDLNRDAPADVDWGIGAAMFLRRADWPAEGPFDERFFMYFEDVDLCYRVWQAGRRVAYYPDVSCIHAHQRASRKALSAAGFYHFQSLLRFITKHRGLPQRPSAPVIRSA